MTAQRLLFSDMTDTVEDQAYPLFFAVLLDPEQRACVGPRRDDLCRRYRQWGKRPDHVLHVTLLGVEEGRLVGALAAAAKVTMPVFRARFDRAMKFGAGRAYVITGGDDVEGFRMLRADLASHLPWRMPESFTPHLTLAYSSNPAAEHWIDPVDFWVRDFVLVESFVGQTRYEIRGRWPLREP